MTVFVRDPGPGEARASAQSILEPCPTPRHHARSGSCPPLQWHTWSPRFRTFLDRCRDSDTDPHVTSIGTQDYDRSYTVELDNCSPFAVAARESAASLRLLDPPSGAYLLQGLLDERVPRRALHLALAAMRAAICAAERSNHAALHARLGQVGGNTGAFLLHADLYVPEMLLLIYDDIPDDGSGELLLLHRDRLVVLLRRSGAPAAVRSRLLSYLDGGGDCDRFEEFYDDLYGPRPWTEWRQRLVTAMHRDAYRIAMRRGEGVLLDDRRWLHGRSRPTGGVSPWRLHRLAFSPATI